VPCTAVDPPAAQSVVTERVVGVEPEVLDVEILVLVERDGAVVPRVITLFAVSP
jgi:hypothetical protein